MSVRKMSSNRQYNPSYKIPTSVIFLETVLIINKSARLIIELNNPTAVEKLYCALFNPILYTYVDIISEV